MVVVVVVVSFSGKSGRPTIATSRRGKETPERGGKNERERRSEKGRETEPEKTTCFDTANLHLLQGALETNCVNSEYKLVRRA